ncbi:hypothetical protein [Xenorhabdus bovienii]|uniref:hypothetical protein n=1 Tax=Xenorhabdus bovienii TaxID=40576 RepID=UPI0023B30490|nr:hypothetical protein [Xenorhabdus bovienii]MDE9542823.1 hypothetical protein [Xenorhabdus bovienii]
MIQNVIQSVNSDTELVLVFAPSINLNNAKYVISTTVPDTVSDGVRHICAINAYIILFLQNIDRWMSESGKVEVEMSPQGRHRYPALLSRRASHQDVSRNQDLLSSLYSTPFEQWASVG